MFTQRKDITRSFIAVLAICAVMGASPQAFAQKPAPTPAPAASPSGDKLDVTDLEKKYWAAKDTDFSVVQNRTYAKANRFALSAQYGTLINDSYSEASIINGSANYYFSERLGIEAMYSSIDSKDSKQLEAFKSQYSTNASHNKQKGFYGVAVNWVPFYAKMAFLSSKIMYFDMAISPFVGMTTYEQQLETQGLKEQTAFTYGFNVTQSYFLSRHFAFRVDYRNYWFNEDVVKFSGTSGGAGAEGAKIRTDLNHSSQLLFGATYFF